MKKFEYKFINYLEEKDALKVSEEELFNELGSLCWELVEINMTSGTAILKREIEMY